VVSAGKVFSFKKADIEILVMAMVNSNQNNKGVIAKNRSI